MTTPPSPHAVVLLKDVPVDQPITMSEGEVILGTLAMVGSGKTITYGEVAPTFEVQAKGLTVASYSWVEGRLKAGIRPVSTKSVT